MQLHDVVTDTILGFNPSYYTIVRGRGMRRREERSVSVVNGESIVSVATNKSKWKGSKTSTQEGRKVALYSKLQQ